jgi:hypothetical protein
MVNFLAALAALAAILTFFGINPGQPLWGLPMPPSRKFLLRIMLALVAASLAMSGYGAYRGYHPKIVIIEKPVDRIVEKTVPADCPKTKPFRSVLSIP